MRYWKKLSPAGNPGMGVGIVEGDEIVYARGFGVQSLETRTPVTPESIFGVASVSKCFVATAAMQLVEQGKIDLDAPIVQYLPYFQLDDERCTQITTRQILSHTSGMPDMDEVEYDDAGQPPRKRRRRRRNAMCAACAAARWSPAPGERFAYSNIAYNVLGDLIAKVSGQTFEDLHEGTHPAAGRDAGQHLFLPGSPLGHGWPCRICARRR